MCVIGGAPRVGNAQRAAAETVVKGVDFVGGVVQRAARSRLLGAQELHAPARTQRDPARRGSIVSGVNGHLARWAAVGPLAGEGKPGSCPRREFRYQEEGLRALPGRRESRPVRCARMRATGRG